MRPFPAQPRKLLVRSTNWIGDAVMTTPAVRTIRRNFPDSEITLLALPWVADIFTASPHVDRIILYEKQAHHRGTRGRLRLVAQLREQGFDAAILLQNAFEAALLAFLAGIPARGGYTTDGRGLLLTHRVCRDPAVLRRHQVHYYQEMLRGLGLRCGPDDLELFLSAEAESWAKEWLQPWKEKGRPIVGLNPGAAYGPAKRWPEAKFARLGQRLHDKTGGPVLVFGTGADRAAATAIATAMDGVGASCLDLTGQTSLAQAMALIKECDLFVTNDSGLMHVAAALGTPLVAIFGSTDHVATGPYSSRAAVVRRPLGCSPCKKTHCPEGHFRCMEQLTVEEVLEAGIRLLAEKEA